MPETVAQRVALALQRHGVELIFAQSLPSAVVLACEALGIRQIAYRQENMGGAMADGFARVSGKFGVVCAQNGPAATLLVPPLSEALKASIPLLALVQEVERPQLDKNAFQEIDHLGLFMACTKWTRRVITADRIDDYLDQAVVAATSGRPGPAALLLPADLLREPSTAPSITRSVTMGNWPLDSFRPGDASLSEAAAILATAENPVIIAGGGAVSSEASIALEDFIELAHVPTFTTNMGKGAINEHGPLACGVLGALNGPGSLGSYSKKILDSADVVFLIGTRTNQNGTDSWRSMPSTAKLIHLDIDPQEIGRNFEALRLTGDVATTLRSLGEAIRSQDLTKRKTNRPRIEQSVAEAWSAFKEDRMVYAGSKAIPIRPERIMLELQSLLTPETIVVADASYSSMWIVGQLRGLRTGQRFITPRGLAGLGWGLPLAMGAKLASPESPVIVLVGDGGFAHSWAEMETLIRDKIPLTILLLNNGVLGYQKDAETVKFGSYTSACHFTPVDHAAIAAACGCEATAVRKAGDIGPAMRKAFDGEGPTLIEFFSDPDAHPPISLYAGTLDPVPPAVAGAA